MISANTALHGTYDYSEVARSIVIAIAASYAALDLAGRVTAARGRIRLAWLSGGSIAMGLGIWTMHFKGMLAFRLPVPVEYHLPTALAALLVAIVASEVALYVASRQKMSQAEALTGSVMMGAGIAGLHYILMAAMRMPAITRYSLLLVTCSICLAILFSLIALLMAFGLREETRWTVPRRAGSAIVMGAAISGMHYTGMAAASFFPASPPELSHTVSITALGGSGVVIATLIVLVAAIVTSSVDRRASAEIRRLNQELEDRVAERTADLEAVNQTLRKEIADRERAEETVRRSEEHLRLVIDTIPQQIWSGPPDGSLDFGNAQLRSYRGHTLEELQGNGWQRFIHPDDLERVLRAWRESVANGTPYQQETRHRAANGQYRWFLVRGVLLKDSEGRMVRWYGTNTDIEDRKQAEDRLRLIVDTTPALLYSAHPDGNLDFFNKRWLDYLGIPLHDIIDWGWTSAIHAADVDDLIRKWRASLATGQPYEAEARVQRADGEYRWMLHRKVPARDDQGNIVKWYGSSVDIEDRKRAEDVVRRSEEHLQLVIDTIPQQIMSGPNDGTLDFANAQWRSYTGLTQEELQGRGWLRIIHSDDREPLLKAVEESRAQGKPYEQEVRRRGADGQYRWFLARGVPLKDSEGRIVRWYGSNTDIQDRKEAENRIRLVIDTAPAMLHSARPDGYVDFFNKRWLEYVGASLQEISGWRWTNVIHPDDIEDILAKWRSSVATGRPFEAEARFRRADGEYRLMLLRKVPLCDEAGSIVKWYGSAIDIEDRKRAEDELRRQKELFQKIFENIPVIIAFRGQDRGVEMVNPEFERAMGWTLKEIRGQNLDIYAVFFPDPDYRQMVLGLVAASNGEWNDLKVSVKDGRVIDVATTFVRLSDGSTLGIGRDVTERKRAEEALRASERCQHKIAKQLEAERARLIEAQAVAKVGSWETEWPNLEVSWSEQTHRIFETDPSHFHPGRPDFVEFIHPEDRAKVDAAFQASLDKGGPSNVEYRIVMADGRVKVLEEQWRVFRDEQGRPIRLMGTCRDVTEYKRADEALLEAQENLARVTRVVAMGELAAAIAHEVNQPLTAIVTNGSFCLRRLEGTPPNLDELRAAIAEIVHDASRASAVISQIRGSLTKTASERLEININQIIQEVTNLLRSECSRNGVSLIIELGADLPQVLGDPVQLQQVLINLIMNAIEAMRTSISRTREIRIRSVNKTDGVLVEVQDSGPGIGPEVAGHIFEPFFTTKAEGIGMGLSISHSIIESHGGHLSFAPGSEGAVFQFTLPTERNEAA